MLFFEKALSFISNLKKSKIKSPKIYRPSYIKIMHDIIRAGNNGLTRIEYENAMIRLKTRFKLESKGYIVFFSIDLYDTPYFSVRWDYDYEDFNTPYVFVHQIAKQDDDDDEDEDDEDDDYDYERG